MKCSILKGRSPIRGNKAVCDELLQGAEVMSKRTSHGNPSKESPSRRTDVNVEERAKHNGRRMIQRRHQDLTCDGVPLCGNSHQHRRYRNPQQPLSEFYFVNYGCTGISPRRQKLVLYHQDHVVGGCRGCYNCELRQRADGKVFAVPGYDEENMDGCFSCIIL